MSNVDDEYEEDEYDWECSICGCSDLEQTEKFFEGYVIYKCPDCGNRQTRGDVLDNRKYGPNDITRNMYRKALHIYLMNAYPGDDVQYYSKWGFIAHPLFWSHKGAFPFPSEVRFGCHCSGNTKLRCYPTGFYFDTNHIGDPDDIVEEVKRIKKIVEDEWEKNGIKVHGRNKGADDDNL